MINSIAAVAEKRRRLFDVGDADDDVFSVVRFKLSPDRLIDFRERCPAIHQVSYRLKLSELAVNPLFVSLNQLQASFVNVTVARDT